MLEWLGICDGGSDGTCVGARLKLGVADGNGRKVGRYVMVGLGEYVGRGVVGTDGVELG